MNMPSSVYNDYYHMIQEIDYSDKITKEGLQRIYDEIYYNYDDGAECIRRLDHYQHKWTMNLH